MLKLFLLVSFTVSALVDSFPFGGEPVIRGGNKTDITEFPHQVALYWQDVAICGGFIFTPKHIVTAALCVEYFDPAVFSVRAGSSSTKRGGSLVDVQNYTIHPKYNCWTREYDIAVLELSAPLKLDNKTMKAIKLATKEPSKGSPALVSGYGALDGRDRPLGILHSAVLPMYDRAECKNFFKAYNVTITPAMTCAGGNKKFLDLGDRGTALIYNNEVLGVASFRPGFDDRKRPMVFTNVVHPETAKFIKSVAKL